MLDNRKNNWEESKNHEDSGFIEVDKHRQQNEKKIIEE